SVSTTKAKRRRNAVRSKAPAASLETLQQQKQTVVNKHLKADGTRRAYDAHVSRGRDFLEQQCRNEFKHVNVNAIGPIGTDDEHAPWNDPEFIHAFHKPNKFSAEALVLYITQKSYIEGCSQSTTDGVYSAFKDYWKYLEGAKYRGKWGFDEAKGEWVGNPAESPEVQDLRAALKHKDRSDGRIRNHATAMTYENMERIMAWSEKECPNEMSNHEPSTAEERAEVTKHLRLRAFASTGFTLFARNNELCNLRRCDVTFGCNGPPPYHQDHIKVTLTQRKGWQHRCLRFCSGGQTYHIYDQPTKPAINSYVHLTRYVQYIERYHNGTEMKPTDYIFPTLGRSGVFQPGSPISTDAVQEMLDWAVEGAGLSERYTTHCFRRGGAQYRFMYAPVGERWTLARIRWWGGWAPGEGVHTLIKYLLDELERMEDNHQDALCPTAPEPQRSLVSEHTELQPATKAEVRASHDSLNLKITDGLSAVNSNVAIT
ncbi:hypothetical protein SCHPADRAFT_811754, partial [Schizopora paradoxa]